MSSEEVLVEARRLENFLTELFEITGIEEEDALFVAQTLVSANLWGIDSHGVVRAPTYIKRLRSLVTNPKPKIHKIKGSRGFEVLDGDNGLGFIVGRVSMKRAIEIAKEYHVGIVGAINSNHFGAAGTYARMAADLGMIGIAMSNMAPLMVPLGARKATVGNNPIALAIPTFNSFPIVLDIALSTITVGKLLLASKKGEKIPLDWATDSEGYLTDDPTKALNGFLLPVGGHKGFGLALVVDILCGVITGGSFLDQLRSMIKYPDQPSLTCHLMIAVNLLSVISREEMKTRMICFSEKIKETPLRDHSQEILLPGEIEYRTYLERTKKGIPLPKNLYAELAALGSQQGLSITLTE
jgi:LDH2 family malate/lactate/ureidoglycolate dehydrogenase